jgi:hypothetical protein
VTISQVLRMAISACLAWMAVGAVFVLLLLGLTAVVATLGRLMGIPPYSVPEDGEPLDEDERRIFNGYVIAESRRDPFAPDPMKGRRVL